MEKVGILAGTGRLPVECAMAARALGYEIYAVALLPDVAPELKDCTAGYAAISVAHLDKVIGYFKQHGITKITMLGKVTKEILFSGQHEQPDARMMKLLAALPDRKDDTLMLAFVHELTKDGMQVFDQTLLLRRLMPQRGTLTKREQIGRAHV